MAAQVVPGGVGNGRAAAARIHAPLEGAEVGAGRFAQLVGSGLSGQAAQRLSQGDWAQTALFLGQAYRVARTPQEHQGRCQLGTAEGGVDEGEERSGDVGVGTGILPALQRPTGRASCRAPRVVREGPGEGLLVDLERVTRLSQRYVDRGGLVLRQATCQRVFGCEAASCVGGVVLCLAGGDDGVGASRQLVAAHKAVSFFVGAEAEGGFGGVAVRLGCTVLALDRGRTHKVLVQALPVAVLETLDTHFQAVSSRHCQGVVAEQGIPRSATVVDGVALGRIAAKNDARDEEQYVVRCRITWVVPQAR